MDSGPAPALTHMAEVRTCLVEIREPEQMLKVSPVVVGPYLIMASQGQVKAAPVSNQSLKMFA